MTREDAEATVLSAARYVVGKYIEVLSEPDFRRKQCANFAHYAANRVWDMRFELMDALANINTHENYRQLCDQLQRERQRFHRADDILQAHENAAYRLTPHIKRIMAQ